MRFSKGKIKGIHLTLDDAFNSLLMRFWILSFYCSATEQKPFNSLLMRFRGRWKQLINEAIEAFQFSFNEIQGILGTGKSIFAGFTLSILF